MIAMFNNLRMALKVGLIAFLMGAAMIGSAAYMGSRMSAIDSAYYDVITRVDHSAILMSQTARNAETYREAAFELLTESTVIGKARLSSIAGDTSGQVLNTLENLREALPEKATEVGKMFATFSHTFNTCKPAVEFAAMTDADGNAEASKKLRDECNGALQEAVSAQVALSDDIVEFAKRAAEERHERTSAEVRTVLMASVTIGLLAFGMGLIVGIFGIARPLSALAKLLQRMARGEHVEMTALDRKDEIGDTLRAVEDVKRMLAQMARDEAEAKVEQDLRVAELRKADMSALADGFEAAVGQIVQLVSSASSELETSAGVLANTAEETQKLTSMVATSSEEASANVQSVAAASEQLTASIAEIGRQAKESARMATSAADQARATTERVSALSVAAGRIGDVVELINSIAGQTNLLALNATIEAARAGEAGRGFAVVASEVKALAGQTARATGEIAQQIAGIQSATNVSVSDIKEISAVVERLSAASATIAASVEEQGMATLEISRNVQHAAEGTYNVSAHITNVRSGAEKTGAASSQVLSAAQSLSLESTKLGREVDRFVGSVRAA